MFYSFLKQFVSKNFLTYLVYLLVISVIILGVFVRYKSLTSHFIGGVDDLGVAKTIIEFDDSLKSYKSKIPLKKHDLLNIYKNKKINHVLINLDKYSILDKLLNFRLWWNHIHSVPKSWTYAPMQFYFTQNLINSKMNLESIKYWGRFTSFIFSVLSILLILIFFYLFSGDLSINRKFAVLISVSLIALSWQNIIYAAQMHSFSIGVFSVIILLLLLAAILKKHNEIGYCTSFFIGIILGLLSMSQYQLLFFYPGFFLTIFIKYYTLASRKNLILIFLFLIIGFLTIAIPFVFPNLLKLQNHGVNWNRGPNDIYLFKFPNGNFFSKSIYFISFFYRNLSIVIVSMLSPIAKFNLITLFFKIIASIFIPLGLLFLMKGNKISFLLSVFILITFFTWVILLLNQKITLSPSRHSMVLVPLFIILFIIGLNSVVNSINSNFIIPVSILFSLFILLCFEYFLYDEMKMRKDNIHEYEFTNVLKQDSSSLLLLYETNYSVDFMKTLPINCSILQINDPWGDKQKKIISKKIFFQKDDEVYVSAFSTCREINKRDIEQLIAYITAETKVKPVQFSLIRSKIIENKVSPDWAFPKIANYNFNSFYYYLYKLVL